MWCSGGESLRLPPITLTGKGERQVSFRWGRNRENRVAVSSQKKKGQRPGRRKRIRESTQGRLNKRMIKKAYLHVSIRARAWVCPTRRLRREHKVGRKVKKQELPNTERISFLNQCVGKNREIQRRKKPSRVSNRRSTARNQLREDATRGKQGKEKTT